ncbi:LytR/AlgR family response regulator transcription factor [Dyadobacter sediminis]|uniref:Response regulator transcription factor n=1 Tax=Dyadobacter sediminis TaxID=1493691 RepID=A0A5R9K6M9_9BACT|nr:LytTR family DNA-binding domain-containing protein [Dyadobacter sediminis]TLU89433.1 response regulator transcription factor [Dyadobacter sediminis]GGC05460.1 DNA-binding response regulator [Dyadobacter sediminis]
MSSNLTGKISCLIIDDEEPAHEVLKFLIAKLSWLSYAGSCYNAVDALEVIPELKPDIIFLDVNMPELSGLDLLSIIKVPNSHVIMTTAYPEYAVDGFTFDVTSFLLKPIGFDRFLKAVTKVRKLLGDNQSASERSQPLAEENAVTAEINPSDTSMFQAGQISDEYKSNAVKEEYMWIRADRKMYCIWFKDIYFIEGLKDYVKVYYANGVLVTLASMSSMMKMLPSPPFVRTHRSYIVNRNSIKMIEGNMVTMLNGMKVSIAVSPTRDEVFRQLTEK